MNAKNPELTVEAKVATKKNAGKGRTPKSPVWKVLDDARKKFNAQIVKSTSVKRECIKACISKYYADDLRFWLDLLSQSEKLLLDSMRFNKACDDLGLAPKTVAQHILFESEKTAKRVLIEGVETVLGEWVKMFTEPALRGREETLCQQQFQCAGDAERSKRYVWFGGNCGLTLLGFRDTFSLGRSLLRFHDGNADATKTFRGVAIHKWRLWNCAPRFFVIIKVDFS